MKSKLALGLLAFSSIALVPSTSFAQEPTTDENRPAATATTTTTTTTDDTVRTLTGCISTGAKAGEYNLKADDGSLWMLHAKSDVKLSAHVGHTVTVTGKLAPVDVHAAKEKKENATSDTAERNHLRVTSVSMVSESCNK